jgi:Co/Zn/Cd efflux system component
MKGSLNLSSAFAGVEEGQDPSTAPCNKACCTSDVAGVADLAEHLAQAPECSAGAEGMGSGMMATLHMALHPGCTCSDHGEAPETSTDKSLAAPLTQTEIKARNLNLVAAMLHLVTDVLRGVLILFVSLLIQLGGVEDAQKADAVCALIVAVLIAAGSIALLVKVVTRLYGFCIRRGYTPATADAPTVDA